MKFRYSVQNKYLSATSVLLFIYDVEITFIYGTSLLFLLESDLSVIY